MLTSSSLMGGGISCFVICDKIPFSMQCMGHGCSERFLLHYHNQIRKAHFQNGSWYIEFFYKMFKQYCNSLQKNLEFPVKVFTKFFRTNFIAFGALRMLDWPFLCIKVKTFILSVRMPNRNPFHEVTHSSLRRRPALKIIIQRSISQVIKIFIAWWNSINRTQLYSQLL